MLRADEKAGKEPNRTGHGKSSPVEPLPQIARAGRVIDLVNELERALCGEAVADSAAVAEGRALAGHRAALRLRANGELPTGGAALRGGWVAHRVAQAHATAPAGIAFELIAGSAQQAVDHVLVAHELVRRIGRPGLCSVSPELATSLAVARLVEGDALRDRLVEPVESGELADCADDVLARVAAWTGRPFERASAATAVEPGHPWRLLDGSAAAKGNGETVTAAPSEVATSGVLIGVKPAGPWAEQLLFEAASMMAGPEALSISRPQSSSPRVATLGAALADGPLDSGHFDLLFVGDPALIEETGELAAVRQGGTLLVHAGLQTPEQFWAGLHPAQRQTIRDGELRVGWIDGGAPTWDSAPLLAATLLRAEPALLEIGTAEAPRSGVDPTWLDLDELEHAVAGIETRFGESTDLPRMPATPERKPIGTHVELLRNFHLTGHGPTFPEEPLLGMPLMPAIFRDLMARDETWSELPILLPASDVTPDESFEASLPLWLSGALGQPAGAGESAAILVRQQPRLVRVAERILEERAGRVPLRQLIDEALTRLTAELELSSAARSALDVECERLRGAVPADVDALGLGEHGLPLLYLAMLDADRRPHRESFLGEVSRLVARLEELLQLDDSHSESGNAPDKLKSQIGGTGAEFVDLGQLSERLPTNHGSRRLEPGRRTRIERTVACLRAFLDDDERPERIALYPAGLDPALGEARCRSIAHADPLRASIGLFDGVATDWVETLRAVRIARLEVDSRYDEATHDPVLDRFGWQGFSHDEMRLLPTVVVFESGRRLRGPGLASLSELIRSGRPVQVVVAENDSEVEPGETWSDLASYHPGLGYLAIAHREPFVLQSTLSRPGHLIAGLRRMVGQLAPAVAVVAVPSWSGPVPPWMQLSAMLHGRISPCFLFDPAGGESWAERFELSDNPQPEAIWPVHPLSFVDDQSGEQQQRDAAFTFAHAVALDPNYRDHFRTVPSDAWTEEQQELVEYLAAPPQERAGRLPFLWAVDAVGRLSRAVVTRELAFACLDRSRAWRNLQELGGTDNEYARRADRRAREAMQVEADEARRALEAGHAEELETVRREAAGEAMERLTRVLMDVDGLPVAAAPGSAPAPSPPVAAPAPVGDGPPATGEPAPAEQPAEADEDDDAVGFNEPYIDSMLCTTCNECTNLNGKLFIYNDNRQAEIGDPEAGTFEQLVKAAVKCPARCIHPGAPRDGDATATSEMIARAKPFN